MLKRFHIYGLKFLFNAYYFSGKNGTLYKNNQLKWMQGENQYSKKDQEL